MKLKTYMLHLVSNYNKNTDRVFLCSESSANLNPACSEFEVEVIGTQGRNCKGKILVKTKV